MQTTVALVAMAAVAYAAPQGVTAVITPTAAAPAGCATSYSGTFEITALNISSSAKRDLEKRTSLILTLAGGKLTDANGRTGYIAANNQFQFDKPPQTGAIYTAGFSACSNYSLALGGSAVWWQCPSGNPDGSAEGEFYNIYNDKVFDTCSPALLEILPQGGSGAVSQQADGQPTGASAPAVSQITDGQPQAPSGVPISQISDGQPQVPTGVPVSQISDGQPQVPTGAPVSQISDGQVQVPTGIPVSQISDGQPQIPTAIPSGAPISQISDGQIQAPTSTPTGAPITQITDGQIQAPTGTGSPITPTAGSNTTVATSTPTPIQVTSVSNSIKAGFISVFAAVIAVALL